MGGWDQSALLARTVGPDDLRYISVSRPGYLGTPLAGRRTAAAQADLYAALLDVLSLDRVVVMAVSGGGPSAVHFAARHPSRCRALVLCSTPGTTTEMGIPVMFRVMTALARWPAAVSWFRARALADPEASARRSILDPEIRARTLADPETAALMRELSESAFACMADRIEGTANDIRITRDLHLPLDSVSAPTLVVHGTVDRLVPFERHARALSTGIRGAELLALAPGEHVAIFTHRAEVRARVGAFLAAHP